MLALPHQGAFLLAEVCLVISSASVKHLCSLCLCVHRETPLFRKGVLEEIKKKAPQQWLQEHMGDKHNWKVAIAAKHYQPSEVADLCVRLSVLDSCATWV